MQSAADTLVVALKRDFDETSRLSFNEESGAEIRQIIASTTGRQAFGDAVVAAGSKSFTSAIVLLLRSVEAEFRRDVQKAQDDGKAGDRRFNTGVGSAGATGLGAALGDNSFLELAASGDILAMSALGVMAIGSCYAYLGTLISDHASKKLNHANDAIGDINATIEYIAGRS